MQKESLDQAINIIIEHIEKSNITPLDKIELMLNISIFLENYDREIAVLKKAR